VAKNHKINKFKKKCKMTKYHNDIINQPQQWLSCLKHCFGEGKIDLQNAAKILKKAKKIVISGIGASYCAGLAIEALLKKSGFQVVLEDSSELMYHFNLQKGDVLLLLSRSGKSVELVKLATMAQVDNIPLISICNDATSPLAQKSNLTLQMNVAFDHGISVSTYTGIILVGIGLDYFCQKTKPTFFAKKSISAIKNIEKWLQKLTKSSDLEHWLQSNSAYYFLARGSGRAASNAAALLWEEGAKMPATTKNTGSFRHGPQEVLAEDLQMMIWLEPDALSFQHDVALCRDLLSLKIRLFIVGATPDFAPKNRTLLLPNLPYPFQILAQQIPAQLAAYHLSVLKGEDADTFKYCNYIVEKEGGL
jgi:glutamine---fructose-6-phosphate transaminase (isomerizing)